MRFFLQKTLSLQSKKLFNSFLKKYRLMTDLRSIPECQRMGASKEVSEKYTVAIEGNIGSGKTELLNYFSTYPETMIVQEPVERWTNVKGHNLLNLMYDDPSRWSLTFQTYVQLTMLDIHKKAHTAPTKLMERSLFSAKYCFVENLFQSGRMPHPEYVVLTEWFEWLLANEHIHVDLIVYLQTRPEVVYQRIKQRSRSEESNVPLEYLRNLHDIHEDWLVTQRRFKLPSPVLVLDGNQDMANMKKQYEKYAREILCQNGSFRAPVFTGMSKAAV